MSFLRKTYYHLKPYLPVPMRYAIRRRVASQILSRSSDVWPVNYRSSARPQNWPGWPDGKKFAIVLTHDVESPGGLAACLQVADFEDKLGFRSSFNFIPEGDYSTPAALRDELARRGFEVGVHDLHHDGKLYRSRGEFRRHSAGINRYLKEWGAVGFRSGFMHHNLGWLHDLDIAYDMSTFDTDPFEPQPDGVDTIFPFWVPRPSSDPVRTSRLGVGSSPHSSSVPQGSPFEPATSVVNPRPSELNPSSAFDNRHSAFEPRPSTLDPRTSLQGYVELPYTLPQDSTLFLLLEQKNINIWKQKLDWIAANGGLALLNVHPDYIRFSREASGRTYPLAFYGEFLEYVRSRHSNDAWFALPRQVAAFCAAFRPQKAAPHDQRATLTLKMPRSIDSLPQNLGENAPPVVRNGAYPPLLNSSPVGSSRAIFAGRRAAVVVFSYYPADPRVRREAEAIASAGAEVDVFCLKNADELAFEVVNGINIYRLPLERQRSGKIRYFYQYGYFLCLTFFKVAFREFRSHYDLVHVHNMPDVLVFAGLLPKLRGAKVILDLHDPTPEVYVTVYNLNRDSAMVRFLNWLERKSIGFADLAITPNIAFKEIFVRRGCPDAKMIIIMNSPQTEVFERARTVFAPSPRKPGEFRLMFHGSLLDRHGLDDLVHAVASLRTEIPGIRLDIYGSRTPYVSEIETLVQTLGLRDHVFYHGGRPLEEIARLILQTDLGIIPNKRTPFTEMNMPTRIFEYLESSKPVIAPKTKGICDYFSQGQLVFFEPGNIPSLADRIRWIYGCPAEVRKIVDAGRAVYSELHWEKQKSLLIAKIADLFN